MGAGKIAAAVGATACLIGAPVALAAATPKGGAVQVFVTNTSQTRAKVTFTGAIGDYGTTVSENAGGKVDPNGDFEKVTLKQGGFMINATALDTKLNHLKPVINPATCSFLVDGSGSATFEDGTGTYTGISGTLTLRVIFAGVSKRTAKGCDFANHAPSYGNYQSIIGSGRVSFKQ